MILVTGGTSHTGCRVVRLLVERGHKVRCLVRTPRNERHLPVSKIEVVRGDLWHPETVRAAMKGIRVLVNVAHIRFAPHLIPLLKESGIGRAIFMSSTRRYTRFPCTSASQVIEGEEAIRKSGLEYTILRPTMIFGGRRDNNMTPLVNQMRRHTLFPLFGSGKNLIQPVFVRDLVEAIVYCVEHPETSGTEYTLAGAEAVSYRRALEIIAREMKIRIRLIPIPLPLCILAARIYEKISRHPRITAEQVRRFGEDKVFDIEPARKEIAFNPRSFEEGIRLKISGEV